jgi:hypothetical protein
MKTFKTLLLTVFATSLISCSGCSHSGRKNQLTKVTPDFLKTIEQYHQFDLKRENDVIRISVNENSFSFQKNRRGEYDVYMIDSLESFKLDRQQSRNLVEKIRKQIADIQKEKEQAQDSAFQEFMKK